MRKFLFPGLVGILLLVLAACGSSATAVPAAKQAPAAPAAPAAVAAPAAQPAAPAVVAAPAAVAKPAAPAAVAAPAAPAAVAAPAAPAAVAAIVPSPALAAYAASHANKPGAIYLGDLKQIVGPAPTKDQGDFDGGVPLESLQRHLYVYDSAYYKGLLEKAKLTNPTPLVSTGQSITIQHACINRALLPCKMSDSYFFPNVLERTKGQVKLVTSSFPELGLAGPDTLRLVTDGTLSMADIYGGYVGGDLPAIEIQVLWGMFPDKETEFRATAAITPDLEKLVTQATGGILINHNWYAGNDQVFITKKPLKTAADFKGLKTRSHSTALSDWIQGMGATAQVVSFAETYAALERGILDAAVSGSDAAFGQRWYEVAKYINWGLESFPSTNNVINGKVWAKIPPDLQAIIVEEGAKSELEALRVAAIQNEVGVLKNTKAGLELVPFSADVKDRSTNEAFFNNVLPSWIKRVGGGNKPIITDVFNPKVGPLVGLRIEANGSVTKIPKVK